MDAQNNTPLSSPTMSSTPESTIRVAPPRIEDTVSSSKRKHQEFDSDDGADKTPNVVSSLLSRRTHETKLELNINDVAIGTWKSLSETGERQIVYATYNAANQVHFKLLGLQTSNHKLGGGRTLRLDEIADSVILSSRLQHFNLDQLKDWIRSQVLAQRENKGPLPHANTGPGKEIRTESSTPSSTIHKRPRRSQETAKAAESSTFHLGLRSKDHSWQHDSARDANSGIDAPDIRFPPTYKTREDPKMATSRRTAAYSRGPLDADGRSVIEDDIKRHGGIIYTKKYAGNFKGGHVASPQLLVIDGEDFLEYRVLVRPSVLGKENGH